MPEKRATKSGWCMDEVVAHDLGHHRTAATYHSACRNPETCPCPAHLQDHPADR